MSLRNEQPFTQETGPANADTRWGDQKQIRELKDVRDNIHKLTPEAWGLIDQINERRPDDT